MVLNVFTAGTSAKASEVNENFSYVERIFNSFEQLSIAVSTSNNSESYSEEMSHHIIKNIGLTSCYINFESAATTDSYELKPFEVLIITTPITEINAITSSGTTTLRVIGQK
jgi:hypothetical protein